MIKLDRPVQVVTPHEGGAQTNTPTSRQPAGLQIVSPSHSLLDLAAQHAAAGRGGDLAEQRTAYATRQHYKLSRGELRNEALAARNFATRTAKSLLAANDSRLEELVARFDNVSDIEEVLRWGRREPGAGALLLAALAQRRRAGSSRRARLEEGLDALLADNDWPVETLGWLEFRSSASGPIMGELKALYQHTRVAKEGLAKWFSKLSKMGDRRRKIKVLIRALGAELSAGGKALALGVHLAAVVRDLKLLLIFLGCEEHCVRIAAVATPFHVSAAKELSEKPARPSGEQFGGLTGDMVLSLVLQTIDQAWLYADWIPPRCQNVGLSQEGAYVMARSLMDFFQILPDVCYRDNDHRAHLLDTFREFCLRDVQKTSPAQKA